MVDDGVNSGARNFGRLMLSLIPWALGIGASVWLGVWIGIHEFRHELSQEDRAAQYTGAVERPKPKIEIQVIPRDCVEVTRADIDGSTLMLYAQNNCHLSFKYLEWHWQEVSPNGTAIHEGYTNQCPVPSPGGSAECVFGGFRNLPSDDRTAVLRVWVNR